MWTAGRRPRWCLLPQGAGPAGCTPHFSFVVPKEKRAVHGPKRKALGALRCSGPPHARGSAYRCLLRFGFSFGHAWVFCEADTAVPWQGFRPRRGARTHLPCFSFRAFRFATRCPGGRGGLYRQADEGIGPYAGVVAFGDLARADT